MKFAVVCLAMMICVASAQYDNYFSSFGGFGPQPGAFGSLQAASATRDPRQNTGPILFPQAPAASGETSGVVVGASGYGFVPPNGQGVGDKYSQRFF